jgi:hypothetical protein
MNRAARRGAVVAGLALVAPAAFAQMVVLDPAGDTALRRTDFGGNGVVDISSHLPPDLIGYQIGKWTPDDPAEDRYTGFWDPNGQFVRLDFCFTPFANPPGPLAVKSGNYAPYVYGDHPVFGFIEIDMDDNLATGGETDAPVHRYLANVARFGGRPFGPRFTNRVATNGQELGLWFDAPPYIQRSGEEFHIVLLGDEITQVEELVGDGDCVFEPDETWLTRGTLLHRAHGYEPFSVASGPPLGAYLPQVELRWDHVPELSVVVVTLVYPLTQSAAAEKLGERYVEPPNGYAYDQNSIVEALDDLSFSVQILESNDPLRNDPRFPLIADWEYQSAPNYLAPESWQLTFLVGMAYVAKKPDGALFAWTDVLPDAVVGDFDGSGAVTPMDVGAVSAFIVEHDGDGILDGGTAGDKIVHLAQFAPFFCMYDMNYDGLVDEEDGEWVPLMGDVDFDNDVDMADRQVMVTRLLEGGELMPPPQFEKILNRADFLRDGLLDSRDLQGFVDRLMGGPPAPLPVFARRGD